IQLAADEPAARETRSPRSHRPDRRRGTAPGRARRLRLVAARRAHAGARRLPVLAVTARSRAEDRDRCLNAGMDDYLAKPINAASLWAAVDRLAVRASAGTAERGTTSAD